VVAIGITSLAIVVAALTIALIGRAGRNDAIMAAVIVVVLMGVEYALASGGVLREWTRRPPPLLVATGVPILLALVTALSGIGGRVVAATSFAAIIGIQAFRFPLELVMHQAAMSGLMPVQMSYSGRSFDIVTGILAIPVALLAMRPQPPRGLIVAWNVIGTLLLINIVVIAIASTPVFAAFGRDRLNTWVADAPYVFLPTVLVPAAVFGHALTWRKLAMEKGRGVTLDARARSSVG
jgi:hypothetical protein